MGKTAFLFPGQGAQYAGMGKGFYDNVTVSKAAFDEASEAAGLDVPALAFEENIRLNITEYTQIAMVATEVALLRALEERGISCDYAAGHSLGEYSAMTAVGAIKQFDTFALVRKRGIFMQEAYPEGGAMSAVLGAEEALIDEAIEGVEGIVSVANYNCPGQIVITGEEEAVKKVSEKLTEKGVKKIVPLKVSGPFHSALMKGAGERLKEELVNINIANPRVPYIANLTAEEVKEASDIPGLLAAQLSGPVLWTQTIKNLITSGVDTFVEIGPGKTLAGFNKRIDRNVRTVNIDKYENFEEAVAELARGEAG
ncbi:MAG: ACP S-malonyltransferase [Lachnospiraceae bacterium]|nr:ACP S-malonyltransferase [Lachnospiraceae bacterium]